MDELARHLKVIVKRAAGPVRFKVTIAEKEKVRDSLPCLLQAMRASLSSEVAIHPDMRIDHLASLKI